MSKQKFDQASEDRDVCLFMVQSMSGTFKHVFNTFHIVLKRHDLAVDY